MSQRFCQAGGAMGVHEDAGALQIVAAVAPRRELEMPFEKGAAGAEFIEDFVLCHGAGEAFLRGHWGISGHWWTKVRICGV